MRMRVVSSRTLLSAIKSVSDARYFTRDRCAKRLESCKGVRYSATCCKMDALKTALQNGSSTIASSLLLTAIAERDAARDAAAAASSAASPCRQEGPQMHLDNAGLWRQFCNMTNEMIVTKAGR